MGKFHGYLRERAYLQAQLKTQLALLLIPKEQGSGFGEKDS